MFCPGRHATTPLISPSQVESAARRRDLTVWMKDWLSRGFAWKVVKEIPLSVMTCLIAVAGVDAWMDGKQISSPRMQILRLDADIAVLVRVGAAFGCFDVSTGTKGKGGH